MFPSWNRWIRGSTQCHSKHTCFFFCGFLGEGKSCSFKPSGEFLKEKMNHQISGFHSHGVPQNGWFIMDNPIKIRMITRGTPILGNAQVVNFWNLKVGFKKQISTGRSMAQWLEKYWGSISIVGMIRYDLRQPQNQYRKKHNPTGIVVFLLFWICLRLLQQSIDISWLNYIIVKCDQTSCWNSHVNRI